MHNNNTIRTPRPEIPGLPHNSRDPGGDTLPVPLPRRGGVVDRLGRGAREGFGDEVDEGLGRAEAWRGGGFAGAEDVDLGTGLGGGGGGDGYG